MKNILIAALFLGSSLFATAQDRTITAMRHRKSVILPTAFMQINLDGCTTSGTGCTPSSSTVTYNIAAPGTPGAWNGAAGGGTGFYDTSQTGLASGVAGHFNGTTNYVQVNGAAFTSSHESEIAWVKTTHSGTNMALIDSRFNNGNGCVIFVNATNVASFYCNPTGESDGASAVNNGVYHCLAGIYTPGATTQVFTDGVAGALHSGGNSSFTSTTATIIGADYTIASMTTGNIAYATLYNITITSTDVSNVCGAEAFLLFPELRPLNRPEWAYGATEERLMFYKRRLAA